MMTVRASTFKKASAAKETVEFTMKADAGILIARVVKSPNGYQIRINPHKTYPTVWVARRVNNEIVWSKE